MARLSPAHNGGPNRTSRPTYQLRESYREGQKVRKRTLVDLSTLPEEHGLGAADETDLYAAMDWPLERQGAIRTKLAVRHLSAGALALYDLSSGYFEGRCCPLAKIG